LRCQIDFNQLDFRVMILKIKIKQQKILLINILKIFSNKKNFKLIKIKKDFITKIHKMIKEIKLQKTKELNLFKIKMFKQIILILKINNLFKRSQL